jgi:hypothetical protein
MRSFAAPHFLDKKSLLPELNEMMDEQHEELFGQYIAEFASEYDIKLDDDGIMKAIELFDECSHRWKSNLSASIYDMATDLDFNEMDEDIVEMVSVVWKRMFAN